MLGRERKKDVFQNALEVVEAATGEKLTPSKKPNNTHKPAKKKNPAAVALGKLGASKGGKAIAKALSAKKRKKIAILAAKARWKKNK